MSNQITKIERRLAEARRELSRAWGFYRLVGGSYFYDWQSAGDALRELETMLAQERAKAAMPEGGAE
jgi:hypothetical protein